MEPSAPSATLTLFVVVVVVVAAMASRRRATHCGPVSHTVRDAPDSIRSAGVLRSTYTSTARAWDSNVRPSVVWRANDKTLEANGQRRTRGVRPPPGTG